MAYIGKAPNTAIVNQATSQSFSGNGSTTAFTLNRSVNVGEDLEVFVENVQQEPGAGKSYTASGTTLTFDEAPPSGTNNIYVIYRGEATINPRLEHDANAALSATTGTFSGAVTVANGLTVDDDGAVALTVDRATSNGNVAEFQKDGSTLAQIGALGVRGYFAADNAGISPYQNVIYPTNGTGTAVDNTVDIGHSSYRPKDLYLSGNLYIGGTGTANALDDYEEGFWTPAFGTSGTGFSSIGYHVQIARYVKVGRQVHTWFLVATNALTKGSASSSIVITGLPFTVENVDYQSGVIAYSQTWVTNHPISCLGSPNQTQLFLYHTNGSTSHVNTSVSNMADHSGNNRHYVYGALSYRAA